jgi:hypothetical protein
VPVEAIPKQIHMTENVLLSFPLEKQAAARLATLHPLDIKTGQYSAGGRAHNSAEIRFVS